MTVIDDALFVKWVNASVNLYFKDVANDLSIQLYIDGQEPQFEVAQKLTELRLNGPRVTESNSDNYKIELDVMLMCSAKLGTNDYTIHDLVGAFFKACAGPINIFKQDGTDDPEYIGCFLLRGDVSPPRDIIPWGLVQVSDGPLRVNQTSVEAYYVMNL